MRKKHNPPGSPTPEETSAISTPASIAAAQRVAGPENTKPGVTQRVSGSASDPVNALADLLEAYRASGSKKDRELFYKNAWELIEQRTRVQLWNYAWKGDVRQDAKEIASAVCIRMCQQEEQQKGIFCPERATEHMRGYLNSAIYQAVSENKTKLSVKLSKHADNTRSLDDEEAPLAVPETRKYDWLPNVLRLSKALDTARVKTNNIPDPGVGIDSTELLLDLDLRKGTRGGELKQLAEQPGVPDRTQHNWTKNLREGLRRELEI